MEMNLRNRLKATIPDQLALTPQKKEEILEAAHVRFEQQQTPVKKTCVEARSSRIFSFSTYGITKLSIYR